MKDKVLIPAEFTLFDHLPTGACVLQNDLSVIFWNARLEEWTGIIRDDIIGKNIVERFPRLQEPRFYCRLEDAVRDGLHTIFSSKLHHYFIPAPLPDGQMRKQRTTLRSLDIPEFEEFCALVIIEDVTDLTKTIGDYRAMRDSALEEIRVRKEAEERFRNAFDINPDGITIERLSNNIIVDVNESWLTATGYRRGEVIGKTKEDLNMFARPAAREQLLEEVQREGVVVNHELPVRIKDGSIRTELVSLCLFYIAQEPFVLSIGKDITDFRDTQEKLRASLREKEVLLKEIHHRVKNNMLTISSLLSLQAQEARDERVSRMAAKCMNRIQAMAMIHETLYSTESMAQIELGAYLEKLLNRIQSALVHDTEKILLKTESDEINLSPDQAIPCALVINELVSNSIEHAFPGGRPGTITVQSRLQGDKVRLTVSDNGIGKTDEPAQSERNSSLGLKLVQSLVVYQLNGTIEESKGDGTRFIIVFTVAP
jgi:PAS domain S-box-containing protein